jgi:hypothetical protein
VHVQKEFHARAHQDRLDQVSPRPRLRADRSPRFGFRLLGIYREKVGSSVMEFSNVIYINACTVFRADGLAFDARWPGACRGTVTLGTNLYLDCRFIQ